MKIMTQYRFALLAVLASAMIAEHAPAQTTQSAFLYLAHAVPGRNVPTAVNPLSGGLPVPTPNPAFPVDFRVGNTCVAKGVSFRDIRGPFSWPAGIYDLSFTPANNLSPCSGNSLFSARVTFAPGIAYIGVLTLDASSNITGQLYDADISSIPAEQWPYRGRQCERGHPECFALE